MFIDCVSYLMLTAHLRKVNWL